MNTNNLEKKTILQSSPFFFYTGLYFLISICFISSFLVSVEFLVTLKINYYIIIIARFFFIFLIMSQLLFSNFGKTIVSFFISNFMLQYCSKIINYLENIKKNYPYLLFLFMYLYLWVFVIYWFTILFTEFDLRIAFFYYIFNIIRLLFFPVIIVSYILNNGKFLMMEQAFDLLNKLDQKEILKVMSTFKNLMVKGMKSNPKSAALLAASAFGVGGFSVSGYSTKEYIGIAMNNPHITGKTFGQLNDSKESWEISAALVSILLETNKSSLTRGVNDFLKIIKGEPTLQTEFISLVNQTTDYLSTNPAKSLEEQINLAKQHAIVELKRQQLFEISGTQLSRAFSQDESDASLAQETLAAKDTSLASSHGVSKTNFEIPSVLEDFIFSF